MECRPEDHSWDRAEPEPHKTGGLVIKVLCRDCGVGHMIVVRQTSPYVLQTQLTILPAKGSDTISRDVIRWSITSWEASNKSSEERGIRVERGEPVIHGTPVGI